MEGAEEGKGAAGKSHQGSSANKRTPQSGSGRRCQVISGSQNAAAVVLVKRARKVSSETLKCKHACEQQEVESGEGASELTCRFSLRDEE